MKGTQMTIWSRKMGENFRFTSDLVITNLLPKDTLRAKKDRYGKGSLYKRRIQNKSAFWRNNNIIQLTRKQEEVINIISFRRTMLPIIHAMANCFV